MEGPSLVLAAEQLRPFVKKKILAVGGNTKIGTEIFPGKTVRDIFSWGKHLVFQFDAFALRVHFLLFGTFAAEIGGISITGDYRKARVPRLAFRFQNGRIEMYNCSVKIVHDPDIKRSYDFSADIMAAEWDAAKALKKTRLQAEEQIGDVLLDQDIFAGVGNIIKNEVLFLTRTHPETKIADIKPKRLKEIVAEAERFSRQFYEWRKVFQLKKNLTIYRKPTCPHCDGKVTRKKTGTRERWSFFCATCQPLGKSSLLLP